MKHLFNIRVCIYFLFFVFLNNNFCPRKIRISAYLSKSLNQTDGPLWGMHRADSPSDGSSYTWPAALSSCVRNGKKKNGKKWWQSKVISHKLKKVIRGFVNLFSITFESLSNRAIRFFAPLWRTQRPWSRKISIWRRWSWFFSRTHAQPAKNSFRFPRAYFLGDSQIIQQKLNSFAGCLVRRQSVTVNSNPSKKDSRVKC